MSGHSVHHKCTGKHDMDTQYDQMGDGTHRANFNKIRDASEAKRTELLSQGMSSNFSQGAKSNWSKSLGPGDTTFLKIRN